MPKEAEDLALSITISNGTVNMGSLKSVCSSWFGHISRDKYKHTHLRLWKPSIWFQCIMVFYWSFFKSGLFWSFLVLFGLFWSFLILSGPFLSYLAQFATLWLNFSLNLFITHLFSLMPISLFFTKEILHQGECKQNLEYPVLCSHESSLRFSLYTCILTQWLLLGMFVQKLLDTNLNFRYQ